MRNENDSLKQPEPKWHDNTPEHGVLCWAGNYPPISKTANTLRVIIEYDYSRLESFIMYRSEAQTASWRYAFPLTNKEVE